MNAHKTFSGLTKAVENLISELENSTIDSDREYKRLNKKCSALQTELRSLWSNPADKSAADQLGYRLSSAWNNWVSL